MTPLILDPCCGSRMMWHDRQRAGVVYGDCRHETRTVTDNRMQGNWLAASRPKSCVKRDVKQEGERNEGND